jgi:hypothetical protein
MEAIVTGELVESLQKKIPTFLNGPDEIGEALPTYSKPVSKYISV